MGYFGLFVAAFGAATLLPLQSEAVLVGLLVSGHYSLGWLLGIATLGNVLGSLVNWWLGRWVEHFKGRRWFPVSDRQLEKARTHYQRWGHWTLLLSWVPIVGDPLYGGVHRRVAADVKAVTHLQRPFLHASKLAFHHPADGRRMAFESQIPEDLQRVLDDLRGSDDDEDGDGEK